MRRVHVLAFLCVIAVSPFSIKAVAGPAVQGSECPAPDRATAAIAYTGGFTSSLVKQWKAGSWSDLGNVPTGGVWSISGTAEDDLWIGVANGASTDYQLYHWDGIDWALQVLPLQKSDINQKVVVHAFARDSVIAYGVGGLTGSSRLWHFNGSGWAHLYSPPWSGEQQGTMLALAPDLIYFAGNGWWGYPGLFRWNGLSLEQEAEINLVSTNESPPYIYQYSGLAWDGTHLWIIDAGGGGNPAHLRRGNFGSPWTLVQTLNPADGYGYTYSTHTKKCMVMDENGVLSISAQGHYGTLDAILQGDPNTTLTEIDPGTGGGNFGTGEKAAVAGYYLMTNNHRGSWYDPDSGSWSIPDNGWGNSCGAHILICPHPSSTVDAQLSCMPSSGTVPFNTTMTVTFHNRYICQARRMAGRLSASLAGGAHYDPWRSGFTNIGADQSFTTSWNQSIPALGSVIGDNLFLLVAEDVTPSPYNQPPYPASGDTDSDGCTVSAFAP